MSGAGATGQPFGKGKTCFTFHSTQKNKLRTGWDLKVRVTVAGAGRKPGVSSAVLGQRELPDGGAESGEIK